MNEDSDWAARARWVDVPVWAGPSGTTHGLCWMLRRIGQVTNRELVACCCALFALWASPKRNHYPKTATPIHHLFGVVTGASDYLPDEYKDFWDPEKMYAWLAAFIGLAAPTSAPVGTMSLPARL